MKNDILNNSQFSDISNYNNENKINEDISVMNSDLKDDTESATKQRQRYFALYSTEAAQLALECADSARMKHSIGKVILLCCIVLYCIVLYCIVLYCIILKNWIVQ